MSGMLPLFIQMACSAFFEYLLAGNRITGKGDARRIAGIFFDEANAHFQHAWDEFGEYSRDVCNAIWVGKKIDEDCRNIVIDLIKRGYLIERNEEYKLFSSTFGKRIVSEYTRENSGL
jgi:hypothetical protein